MLTFGQLLKSLLFGLKFRPFPGGLAELLWSIGNHIRKAESVHFLYHID